MLVNLDNQTGLRLDAVKGLLAAMIAELARPGALDLQVEKGIELCSVLGLGLFVRAQSETRPLCSSSTTWYFRKSKE